MFLFALVIHAHCLPQGSPAGGAQAVMQQYTRLAVLTAEVVVACGLAPAPEPFGTESEEEEQGGSEAVQGFSLSASGYTAAFTPGGESHCGVCVMFGCMWLRAPRMAHESMP